MTQPLPPNLGDQGWGAELNNYLENTLEPLAQQGVSGIAAHISAAPASAPATDPHGDRAYALGLMAPLLSLINQAGGFVQLTASGFLPGDAWHNLRPLSGSFVAPPSGQYPPQYRLTMDGDVRLAGYVGISSGSYNGVTIFPGALPPAYRPNMTVSLPVTISATGTTTTTPPAAALLISSTGTMTFANLPPGLTAGTYIGIYGAYPLDAPHSLIQS